MKVKKFSQRQAALIAAVTVPMLLSFNVVEADPNDEIKAPRQSTATAADRPEVEQSDQEAAQVPEPYRSRTESAILDYLNQFEGKTIVDIEFEGASSATLPTVKAAVIENVGDTFNPAMALRDRNALINTGYFYEAYQTFEVIPEGVVITFHVMENPILNDVIFVGQHPLYQ